MTPTELPTTLHNRLQPTEGFELVWLICAWLLAGCALVFLLTLLCVLLGWFFHVIGKMLD